MRLEEINEICADPKIAREVVKWALRVRDVSVAYVEEGLTYVELDARDWNADLFRLAPEIFGKYWPGNKNETQT